MTDTEMTDLGRLAYDAYASISDPEWEDLPQHDPGLQDAWRYVADAVQAEVERAMAARYQPLLEEAQEVVDQTDLDQQLSFPSSTLAEILRHVAIGRLRDVLAVMKGRAETSEKETT